MPIHVRVRARARLCVCVCAYANTREKKVTWKLSLSLLLLLSSSRPDRTRYARERITRIYTLRPHTHTFLERIKFQLSPRVINIYTCIVCVRVRVCTCARVHARVIVLVSVRVRIILYHCMCERVFFLQKKKTVVIDGVARDGVAATVRNR